MAVSQKTIDAVSYMKALDLRTASESDIRSALQMVNNTALLTSDFPVGNSIARARCVRDFTGSNIYRERDISYSPNPKWVGVGRANMAEQPVFYGVSMVDMTGTVQPRVISYAETSTLISDDSIEEGEEFVVIGRWRVIEPFKVVWFVHNQSFNQPDPHLPEFRKSYDTVAGKLENYEDSLYINEALASEFAKEVAPGNGYAYGVTSVIGKYLLEELECDAVGFPSVKAEGNGLNLAIHPRVLDAGKMKLEVVLVEKAYRFGKQYIASPYLMCNKFRQDGSFMYELNLDHKEMTKEELRGVLLAQGYNLSE